MKSSDAELSHLVAQIALKDGDAFRAVYERTSPKLFGVCLRILKDREDAQDALQEVYVKIWRNAQRFAGSNVGPMPWLCAIARNHAIDVLRARRPASDSLEEGAQQFPDDAPDPESTAVIKGEGRRIDRCMQELDPQRAEAVKSAYVEGLSYQELAKRHAVPLNTMRTWLRRSLLSLRECMER
ncbi:RNA polymerase sigma-70 factor (ECF subfamily) [Neorhizobium galegae]|uniref:sigma-70 family RNA polymerase sigma factor n=1 Tax=Neorhizobium galegae TaxID=399 RepID=UPI001AE8327D|nr:RNA polymerase sigma-70 factor (ECF subfamily) [Neorhizobium galegae]